MKEKQFTTKKDLIKLEKKFDKRFAEQARVIISAVDIVLEKRLGKMESNLERKIYQTEIRIGQVETKLEKKIEQTEAKLEKKIDETKNAIDGYIKKQEDFNDEFEIMKVEMKQVKDILKQKLGVEIKAI